MAPLISVVDDDDSVRESLESLIRSVGFTAKVFASAEEFLNSAYLRKTDCLVLDVRMPGMSGIELHRQLAASGSKVPVIFITSHGCHDARSQALSHGAVAHLTKPFSQDELLQAVRAGLKSNSS